MVKCVILFLLVLEVLVLGLAGWIYFSDEFSSISAQSLPYSQLALVFGQTAVASGDVIHVPITLQSNGNSVLGVDAVVSFNPDHLNLISVGETGSAYFSLTYQPETLEQTHVVRVMAVPFRDGSRATSENVESLMLLWIK